MSKNCENQVSFFVVVVGVFVLLVLFFWLVFVCLCFLEGCCLFVFNGMIQLFFQTQDRTENLQPKLHFK